MTDKQKKEADYDEIKHLVRLMAEKKRDIVKGEKVLATWKEQVKQFEASIEHIKSIQQNKKGIWV